MTNDTQPNHKLIKYRYLFHKWLLNLIKLVLLDLNLEPEASLWLFILSRTASTSLMLNGEFLYSFSICSRIGLVFCRPAFFSIYQNTYLTRHIPLTFWWDARLLWFPTEWIQIFTLRICKAYFDWYFWNHFCTKRDLCHKSCWSVDYTSGRACSFRM